MKKGLKNFLICTAVFIGSVALSVGAYLIAGGEIPAEIKNAFHFTQKEEAVIPTGNEEEKVELVKDVTDDLQMLGEVPFEEYDMSDSKTGNLIGNLKGFGNVASKGNLALYSIHQKGIFKFDQESEDTSYITNPSETPLPDSYSFLNFAGDKIVYIDLGNFALYSIGSNAQGRIKLAENAYECLLYDKTVYYVSNGGVYSVDVGGGESKTIYANDSRNFSIIGLTNSRIYLSCTNMSTGTVNYLSVKLSNPENNKKFFPNTTAGQISNMQYCDGNLYYVRDKMLYRKNIGVDNEEKIADGVKDFVVKRNCIYFGKNEEKNFNVYELNTKTMVQKQVMELAGAGERSDMAVYVAGEYVFAMSTQADAKKKIAVRTSLWTSLNDMASYNFEKNGWNF